MANGLVTLVGAGAAEEPWEGAPRIQSLLIKPASALCNLDCTYCFYLDRETDPYADLTARRMSDETLRRLTDSYLAYSHPHASFGFQGGEPTLVGVEFFERFVKYEEQYGRGGSVSNTMQTNGLLLNKRWCALFRESAWLIGLSIDGPQAMHDRYRVGKEGRGSWRKVMNGLELMQREGVEFNVLCVLSQANVEHAREVYSFFRGLAVEHMQFIPLAEFDGEGRALPYTITPEQYGRFLCEVFELWWPERRTVRVRFFDNIAEALAGQKPGSCTMHESCDSYAVVEYNGDVYPCDFFVEKPWTLGNVHTHTWGQIAREGRRRAFAGKKAVPHAECSVCEYRSICHGGCPALRKGQHGRFEDLDYFCGSYKAIFGASVERLKEDVALIFGESGERSSTFAEAPADEQKSE